MWFDYYLVFFCNLDNLNENIFYFDYLNYGILVVYY